MEAVELSSLFWNGS